MKLTFKLLADILKIFEHSGEIRVYWNYCFIQSITEDSRLEAFEELPEDCTMEDLFIEFPGYAEVEFDTALSMIKKWEKGERV